MTVREEPLPAAALEEQPAAATALVATIPAAAEAALVATILAVVEQPVAVELPEARVAKEARR